MKNTVQNLPHPDVAAHEHSDHLRNIIAAEIQHTGPISFARYMQQALYAPGLGYYNAGAHKLGSAGDFVTAPELSPLFSQCVARQCQQVLQGMQGGCILELGAGSGVMALEILRELQRQDCLPEHYYILEVSADLRARQRELLVSQAPELLPRVDWLDALPMDLRGVIVANEVLDAMPVHKVKYTTQGWQEFYVTQEFAWQLGPLSSGELSNALAKLGDVTVGYETEINLLLAPWIASLAQTLTQGLILLIDYGFPRHEYYHADRSMGTLMCHYQHRAHTDPLILTGIQDITAHVDFTAVAEAAVENTLTVEGFTHQAAFLINCGITEMLNHEQDVTSVMRQNNQVKQLMLPSEMGELFKAIALTKNFSEPLLGFRSINQVEKL